MNGMRKSYIFQIKLPVTKDEYNIDYLSIKHYIFEVGVWMESLVTCLLHAQYVYSMLSEFLREIEINFSYN